MPGQAERDEAVSARCQAKPRERVAAQRPVLVSQQAVHHDVAHQADPFIGAPFGPQAGDGVGRRGEEVVADPVGDRPVDLGRPWPVLAAQTGPDMAEQCPGLRRHQRAGQRRVRVPRHYDDVGPQPLGQRLERRQHRGRPGRVTAGAGPEIVVRPQAEPAGRPAADRGVVALAGMDTDDLGTAAGQCVHDRPDRQVAGPGTGNADNSHGAPRRCLLPARTCSRRTDFYNS